MDGKCNTLPRVDVVFDFRKEAVGDKPGTVHVRVYESRTSRKYISTGVRVRRDEWSDQWHVVGREDAAVLNRMIDEQVRMAEDKIRAALDNRCELPSVSTMKVDKNDASFLDFMREQIGIDKKMNEKTRAHHYTTMRMLEEFGKIRRFEHVTKKNLQAFVDWVGERTVNREDENGEQVTVKIGQSTVYDHWKRLRKYIRIAQGEQLVPMHVLVNFEVDKGEEPMREHLTDEEIDRLLKTKLPYQYLRDARDRFVVAMGTGLSFKDLMTKNFKHHEVIDGVMVLAERRTKTNAAFFTVILPFAVEVLERWNWELPGISLKNYNEFIGKVMLRCQIDKHVTSHVARHTFACYCLRHGIRLEAVQRTLGHKKIETTQKYAILVDMDVISEYQKSDIAKKSKKRSRR